MMREGNEVGGAGCVFCLLVEGTPSGGKKRTMNDAEKCKRWNFFFEFIPAAELETSKTSDRP